MPYASSGLSLVAYGAGASVFIYRTADTLTQVLASGYFNDAAAQFNVGDEIILTAATGGTVPTQTRLRVIAASASAVSVAPQVAQLSRSLDIAVTATANTDLTIPNVPPCVIRNVSTITTTAFTGNTVTAQVGTAAGGVQIVAAVSVKSAGIVNHTVVAAGAVFAGGTLHVRIVQTATETAVGAATMVVDFIPT
jgi:hypothetical protein